MTKPLTLPLVVNCAEPVVGVGFDTGASLRTKRLAPAARVCVTEEALVTVLPCCGNEIGSVSGVPVASAKKFKFTDAAVVPVLTNTNVVCQPLPVAICAMEPPLVPTLASAGIVVSALLGGV